jgi:hypothetical protein
MALSQSTTLCPDFNSQQFLVENAMELFRNL